MARVVAGGDGQWLFRLLSERRATNGIRKNSQDNEPAAEFASAPNQTARQLFDYMTFRAHREGQEHTLTVEFYERQLDRGAGSFFGVYVGPNCKGLLRDVQRPALFKEWLSNRYADGEEAQSLPRFALKSHSGVR